MKKHKKSLLGAVFLGSVFGLPLQAAEAQSRFIEVSSEKNFSDAEIAKIQETSPRDILVISPDTYGENYQWRAEDIEEILSDYGYQMGHDIENRHLEIFAQSLNNRQTAAMRPVVNPNQDKAPTICLISMPSGPNENYMQILSSLPASMIERRLGLQKDWMKASAYHEIEHCKSSYPTHNPLLIIHTLVNEVQADQNMIDYMKAHKGEVKELADIYNILPDYRRARILGSVHFTHYTHHTEMFLNSPETSPINMGDNVFEVDRDSVAQNITMHRQLRTQVGYMMIDDYRVRRYGASIDRILSTLVAFMPDSDLANEKERILRDANNLTPQSFVAKYKDKYPQMIDMFALDVGETARNYREDKDMYNYYYLAAHELLAQEQGVFEDLFLRKYTNAIEHFRPSIKRTARQMPRPSVRQRTFEMAE